MPPPRRRGKRDGIAELLATAPTWKQKMDRNGFSDRNARMVKELMKMTKPRRKASRGKWGIGPPPRQTRSGTVIEIANRYKKFHRDRCDAVGDGACLLGYEDFKEVAEFVLNESRRKLPRRGK